MKKIAIISGGYSSEAEISVKSANVVKKFLDSSIYTAFVVKISETNWSVLIDGNEVAIDKNDFSYIQNGTKHFFDGVFNAIHGSPGENGLMPSYFEMLNLPYTGPKPLQASITFNKWACNTFLQQAKINCAKSFIARKGINYNYAEIIKNVGLPCFVKPNNGGSSFGVTKVKQTAELESAIEKALEHDNEALIESFLAGREVTCGVYKYKGEILALPITEILSKNEFFDYNAKYKGDSEEITPAQIKPEITNEIQKIVVDVFAFLGLTSFARIDFIIVNDKPVMLEVNTVPGLSEQSIIPQQVRAAGMDLTQFFGMMMEESFHK
jgi:D-alanine-D-alanine ligase